MVLPTFNAGGTVARAIASVRAQTFTDWELIVVDDGSTDATAEVLRAWAAADPRVRVLARSHEGLVAALNAGVAAARGRLVARMDADDESFPERLAEQAAFLQAPANTTVGVVSCLVEFGGERVVREGYARHVDWINSLVTPEQIALNRFVESPQAHPSVMFRRELVERHGGYRGGDFPEDYELWLRWLDAGVQIAKVPRVLLRWNDSSERLSRADSRYAADAFFRLKAHWIARWLRANGVIGGRSVEASGAAFTRSTESMPLYVWGAGRATRRRAAYLVNHAVEMAGYIDVDPKKATRALGGSGPPVIGPEDLPAPGKILCWATWARAARGNMIGACCRRVVMSRAATF